MPEAPAAPPASPASAARPRTALAFDYGRRKTGVAVGGEASGGARALPPLQQTGAGPDWATIDRLVDEWAPDVLVVGIPRNMDGSPHAMTAAARAFAAALEKRYRRPVIGIDERLSTWEARDHLRAARASGQRRRARRGELDSMAARILLEDWLRQTT